jgi:uncharacterized membrane protein YfcA
MEVIILVTAFLASLLTLFSGFGLGTLLMPVMALFFPLPIAIALTGIVHLSNNLFKLSLLGKHASLKMALQFGIPSMLGGLAGAWALTALDNLPVLAQWQWAEKVFELKIIKLALSVLMIFFALMELIPGLKNIQFPQRYLTLGGLLSGFFGGLSGHQGALRTAFLIRTGLKKEVFIATGVLIACMVDLTRIPVYWVRLQENEAIRQWPLLAGTCLAAFAGAYLGTRYLQKITLGVVQKITAVLLFAIAILLGAGIL